MTQQPTYDYIIAGGGCAGLSLAVHLVRSGAAAGKKILLIEQDAQKGNDRTWCFWEKEDGLFQSIVRKEWTSLHFYSDTLSRPLDIAPYTYKLIRGQDFYTYCRTLLRQQPGIEWLTASVTDIRTEGAKAVVTAGGNTYPAHYAFSSIREGDPRLNPREYWLLQHFKGWFIQTEQPFFDPGKATLMDFRTGQEEGASFFYVLPFSPTEALVEYTLFSPRLLEDSANEAALHDYVTNRLGVSQYHVPEKEFGVIPMTNRPFRQQEGRVVYIGTAGGQTKGSSGYTFQFIQKHSAALAKALIRTGKPHLSPSSGARFRFYDSVLLRILQHRKLPCDQIFSDLFRYNRAANVLQFLDNETSIPSELRLISTLPVLPFTKAALGHLF